MCFSKIFVSVCSFAIALSLALVNPVAGPRAPVRDGRIAAASPAVAACTWWAALLPACVTETPTQGESKLYGGLTLKQWHDRLGQLDPMDPHSASVVPALIEIIQDQDLAADVR